VFIGLCAAQRLYASNRPKVISDEKEHSPIQIAYNLRNGTAADHEQLKMLYIKVASISGGLARNADEINDQYIDEVLGAALQRGFVFIAEKDDTIIGALLIYTYEARAFSHVLTETTVLVDPAFQGLGIGTRMITALLREVAENRPDILRVEINTRESNRAITLYERLGFTKEFASKNRMRAASGNLESDIYMVWFNPNFKG
jgi:putative acetyltransferase